MMDAKSNNFSNKISFQICENTLIGKTIVELNDESDQGCSRVFAGVWNSYKNFTL